MKCVYIIKGDDNRLIEDNINLLRKEENLPEAEYRKIKDDGLANIIMELSMGSLFSEPSFIVITDGDNLTKVSDKDYNNLLNINKVESDNALAIIVNNSDERIKTLCSKFTTLNAAISGSITDYISNYISKNEYSITPSALEYLVEMSKSVGVLVNICDELFLYKLDDKIIDIKDIDELISKPLDDNVFDLVNAVMTKDKKKAYQIYEDLKVNNITELMLISLLSNRFTQLLDINTLNHNGYTQDMIAEVFNMKTGRVYYLLKDLRNFSELYIKNIISSLEELEYNIKRGLIAPGIGFELFLLKI